MPVMPWRHFLGNEMTGGTTGRRSFSYGMVMSVELEPRSMNCSSNRTTFFWRFGDRYYNDDEYSLHSSSNRIWLPEVDSTTTAGDGREYLLDVPPTDRTMTLEDLKERIAEVIAEYESGDGSEEYRTLRPGEVQVSA